MHRYFLVLFAYVSLFSLSYSPVAQSKVLEGGLQQTDTIPALPDQFQVSRPFSREMLGQANNLDEWVMIPPSVAGTWERNGTVVISVTNELTRQVTHPNVQSNPRGSFIRGFQLDANNNIWDCPRARSHRFETSADGKSVEYIIITGGRQMLVMGPNSLRDFGEVTLVDVDVATNIITRVQRSVQIVLRSLTQDGQMLVDSSTGTYTPEGRLISTTIDRSFERRAANFAVVDSLDGQDLKKAFLEFMRTTGNGASTAPALPTPPISK